MDLRRGLYGLDEEETRSLAREQGLQTWRGDQLLRWLYHQNIASLEEAGNLPAGFRQHLVESFDLPVIRLTEMIDSSNRDSRKFLFKTRDDRLLESVLISQRKRRTICLSTQLGCKIGCPFCASGKGPFGRDLTVEEIIEQVAWIQRGIQEPVTNVVFMGMGEPLDNFEATMKALRILQAPWGFGMGARRITVSTSGITPRIEEFVNRSEGRVRLSVSLHSSQQETRNRLVPVNRKYTLEHLIQTLEQLRKTLKREITFEYTLIEGVNDSRQEALGVAKIATRLKAKINLIPYNPIREMQFRRPTSERVAQFSDLLVQKGIRVTLRQTAGRDINAACGQLRLDRTPD